MTIVLVEDQIRLRHEAHKAVADLALRVMVKLAEICRPDLHILFESLMCDPVHSSTQVARDLHLSEYLTVDHFYRGLDDCVFVKAHRVSGGKREIADTYIPLRLGEAIGDEFDGIVRAAVKSLEENFGGTFLMLREGSATLPDGVKTVRCDKCPKVVPISKTWTTVSDGVLCRECMMTLEYERLLDALGLTERHRLISKLRSVGFGDEDMLRMLPIFFNTCPHCWDDESGCRCWDDS